MCACGAGVGDELAELDRVFAARCGLHASGDIDAPWADSGDGVESAPGRKDPVKLREFIANARAAGTQLPDDASSVKTDDAPYNWEEDFLS